MRNVECFEINVTYLIVINECERTKNWNRKCRFLGYINRKHTKSDSSKWLLISHISDNLAQDNSKKNCDSQFVYENMGSQAIEFSWITKLIENDHCVWSWSHHAVDICYYSDLENKTYCDWGRPKLNTRDEVLEVANFHFVYLLEPG